MNEKNSHKKLSLTRSGASGVGPDDRRANDARVQPPLRVQLGDEVLGQVLRQRVSIGKPERLDDGLGFFSGHFRRRAEERGGRLCVREHGAVGHDQRVDRLLDVLAWGCFVWGGGEKKKGNDQEVSFFSSFFCRGRGCGFLFSKKLKKKNSKNSKNFHYSPRGRNELT